MEREGIAKGKREGGSGETYERIESGESEAVKP